MTTPYDTIIIGARPAGSATGMLLAQAGQRVLIIDKSSYGSDTLSTPALMRGAVESLDRWHLLEPLLATDTPAITTTTFRHGSDTVDIPVPTRPGVPGLIAPRRTVLDPVLVDAAEAAGATVRHDTALLDLVRDGDGRICGAIIDSKVGGTETVVAPLIIGADGRQSKAARLVEAPVTHRGEHSSAYVCKYFRDLEVARDSFVWSYDIGIGSGIIPTTAGATCVFTALERDRFHRSGRRDLDGTFAKILEQLNPDVSDQLPHATQEGPTRSWPGIPGQFRKPHGPGWALVGDAGYFKDPFAAHGISDALRDAELVADAALSGDFESYEALRDLHSAALFEALERKVAYGWDLPTLQTIQAEMGRAMKAEAAAMDAYRSTRDHQTNHVTKAA